MPKRIPKLVVAGFSLMPQGFSGAVMGLRRVQASGSPLLTRRGLRLACNIFIARLPARGKTLWHYPVQGAVFMRFVVPVVRAEKRARTTGCCPFTPPAWQKRPNDDPA